MEVGKRSTFVFGICCGGHESLVPLYSPKRKVSAENIGCGVVDAGEIDDNQNLDLTRYVPVP